MIGDNSKTVVLWGLGIDLDSFLYRNMKRF